MQSNKLNFVVDGQFGSCGKGLVAPALGLLHGIRHYSTTNMPNAGHTAQCDGETHVGKVLPTAAILPKWLSRHGKADRLNFGMEVESKIPTFVDPYHMYVGASAGFTPEALQAEMANVDSSGLQVHIHPRAGIIQDRHKEAEGGKDGEGGSTAHLASTMQGCGEMLAEKVLRTKTMILAGQHQASYRYCPGDADDLGRGSRFTAGFTEAVKKYGALHEGSQGFSLDIHHGHSYPTCTSRQCTVGQMAADMGIPHQLIGDVYVVIRPYPIRVGNFNGNSSGGWYPDQYQTHWSAIGVPAEKTTVTERERRVATFSYDQVAEACRINGATHLVLNFANYLCPIPSASFRATHPGCNIPCSDARYWSTDFGAKPIEDHEGWETLVEFVRSVETITGVRVSHLGMGPDIKDLVPNPWSTYID